MNEITIFGEVRSGLAQQVRTQLANAKGKVLMRINSPGGEVAEGLAIINAMRAYGPGVETIVDGFALSIASAIACAGKPAKALRGSLLMLHMPWSSAVGTADMLKSTAEGLDRAAASLVDIYAAKSKRSVEEVESILRAETWFSADEAREFGLVDEVVEADDANWSMAASFDLSRFKIPERFQMTQPNVHAAIAAEVLAKETERRSEIRALFDRHGDKYRDLRDQLLDDTNATPDVASKKLLAAIAEGATPTAGLRWSENDRVPDFMAAASDALLQRAGLKVDKPHPAARDVSRMSLQDMAESCISMRGGTIRDRTPGAVFKATHTTSDFPLLLANTANKAMMIGYENEPASHMAWVREVDAVDFKTMSRIARSEAPALLEVPEGAEYTQGSFSERREQYSLTTYGRYFECTRQMMVNDDLSAFTTLPAAFGQSARRKEADIVYAILTTNAAMSDSVELFHASHSNLSGVSASITVNGLSAARAAMRKQTGPAGVGVLNLIPRFLIVPAALEAVAESLIASLTDPASTNANVKNPDFIRSLQLVVDPRLDAHSTTAWYLAASPSQVDTIEVARLDGRGVVIDDDVDFMTGGFRLKATLDFAAKAIDWRGLYRYHTS
jgi:ATP-dependent Clp endopeptidase proteolytic subunit ClpP